MKAMTDAIRHRGPDGEGAWTDGAASRSATAAWRSSTCRPAGAQPMASASGRYVVTYNGEIYNHAELRASVAGRGAAWRGPSDTEVLLAALDQWGVEPALQRCVGMFAFAVWDRSAHRLTLARDRFGEKPLYFGWQRGVFLFGSELKALRAHPAFAASVSPEGLADLLRWGYISAPWSIFDGIEKLRAGELAELTLQRGGAPTLRRQRYWRAEEEVAKGLARPFKGSVEDAAGVLEEKLDDSIRLQRQADVPVGAFLSGGIDSSLVVALMQRQSPRPLRTFSIGFAEARFDESGHARAVAAHLGTEHQELMVSPADALAVIPRLSSMFDEPIGDASQIPTYLVARLARCDVTVSVSGDGGDELFGGYTKYAVGDRLARIPGRSILGQLMDSGVGEAAAATARMLPPLRGRLRPARVKRIGRLLRSPAAAIAEDLSDQSPGLCLTGNRHGRSLWQIAPPEWLNGRPCGVAATLLDTLSYLPENVLVKVDRSSMAVSLESRAPLLDHRVASFAFTLPWSYRGGNGNEKAVLRRLLYRHVPAPLVDRPKMGFSLPVSEWLRGELREWAEALIAQAETLSEGSVRTVDLRTVWQEQLAGTADRAGLLWSLLMFLDWRRNA